MMTTIVSSKGQVVLPKQARARLHLRPGMRLRCKVQGDSILLTPEQPTPSKPRQISDPKTGLVITESSSDIKVSSEDVRAAMLEFP
jgi:AbrB family looped-hinge helix DNA binding protein